MRLGMIPFIVWAYCIKGSNTLTFVLLTLSGATDVVDGFIARHYNMVSDFGKAIDPVADKLTQVAMLVCLVTRFPLILLPLILMTVKEILMGVTQLIVIKRTGEIKGAVWHGKLNTVLLYGVMAVHILWYNIPSGISAALICLTTVMMAISCLFYTMANVKAIIANKKGE